MSTSGAIEARFHIGAGIIDVVATDNCVPTPRKTHYARAISRQGSSVWLAGCKSQNDLYRLNLETVTAARVGRVPFQANVIRGISDGRFMSYGARGYTLLTPTR